MKKIVTYLLTGLLFAALLPQASTCAQQIKIDNVWSRPVHTTTDSQGNYLSNGAVYLTMKNSGTADALISVETDVCKKAELHQSKMVNGMMTMKMLKSGIALPAQGVMKMKPGSYHIMLIGLHNSLNPGDTFVLILHFEKSDPVTVLSYVRSP